MKIYKRINNGQLKGWTIRISKSGWYDLYSSDGVSQTAGKHTLEEINEIIKQKTENTTKAMIDPKQKAVEILDKFKDYANDEYHECAELHEINSARLRNAKECAKIAVNEIIEVLSISAISISHRIQEESYWQEVLNELNKM